MEAVLALRNLAFSAFFEVVRRDETRSGKGEGAPDSKESSQVRLFLNVRVHHVETSSADCMSPWSQAGPW